MRWLTSTEGVVEDPDAAMVKKALKDDEMVVWVDIEEPTAWDIELLRDCFGFHSLTLEEIQKHSRRQKIDDYPGYTFMVLQRVDWTAGQLEFLDLEVYLSRHFVVTVHAHTEPAFGDLRRRLGQVPELAREKPAFLQFLVLNQLVEQNFTLLDELQVAINTLERAILSRPTRRLLNRAYDLRQTVIDLDKHLAELHELFQHLITHSIAPEDQQLLIYYRDLFGHVERQHDTARSLSDLAHSVMEVYMAGADNRLNSTMKQLTMVAALFLPVTAISGFFGMNHQFLVQHITGETSFWLTVCLMVLTQGGLAVFFWRRGYF
ncbi:MAG TPA: magnesium transporter CorA family protein [Candidatus Dormibacteraeota bacterium]|nr:magnesium transporter CorA family protein [Candidatus Dormibacteraeota bacterium]